MNPKLKKALFLSPVIIVLSLLFVTSCMTFRQTDKQTIKGFEKRNRQGIVSRIDFDGVQVRYVEAGKESDKNNLIVFVHGAPGSSRDMLSFLYDSILLEHARMISVDRIGYGYSSYGNAEVSIEKQAKLIIALIENAEEANIVLVGHSFGGPIVAKAAVLSPKINNVLMLAPVNDPYNEKMFWVANFGKWKLTNWLLSKAWKVSADEKFAHEEELLKMKDDWKKLSVPVVHIHGHKDFLAPLSNVEWSKNNIPANYLKVINDEKLDHFIPFKNQQLVISELMLMMK